MLERYDDRPLNHMAVCGKQVIVPSYDHNNMLDMSQGAVKEVITTEAFK
jgi:hypothetical protein